MKVLVVSGGSGGHIFPALSFLKALRNKYKELDELLVLPRPYTPAQHSLINSIISKQELPACKVKYISISRIELRFDFKNFLAGLRFLKGSLESLFIMLEFKPDMVAGFGSLNSVPLLSLAWLFRINTIIHEQNVIPGRANRWLAKLADKIAISFPETKNYFLVNPEKIALTGNPLRPELKNIERFTALSFFGFQDGKITILVAGGSQGSQRVNLAVLKALSRMPEISNLQVVHISGVKDYAFLDEAYKELKAKVKLFTFLSQMHYALSIADLAICRAGASTITELIEFGVPAIIIPYPFANQHQLANAKVLEKRGSAFIIEDRDLDKDRLSGILEDLTGSPDKLKIMRLGYDSLPKNNANALLADLA